MYTHSKLSNAMLLIVAPLVGFTSTTYIVYSSPVDPNDLPGIANNPAFSLLKGQMSGKGNINNVDIPGHESVSEKKVEFGHLTVIVHIADSSHLFKQIKSSDFTVHVSGSQQSTDTFSGSESGTEVKVAIGNYQVTEDVPEKNNFGEGDINIHFSQDCSGIIHNNEDKICKITNTIL